MAESNSGHPHAVGDSSQMVIDESVEIVGNITVKGRRPLVVRGAVEGHIQSDGPVAVEDGGFVKGTLSAGSLVVAGRVEGTAAITVFGLLDMRTGGELIGKRIAYGDLQHARGAKLTGDLEALEVSADALINCERFGDELEHLANAAVTTHSVQGAPVISAAAVLAPAPAPAPTLPPTAVLVRFAAPADAPSAPAAEEPVVVEEAPAVTSVQRMPERFAEVAASKSVRPAPTFVLASGVGLSALLRPEAALGVDQVPFRENLPPLVSDLPQVRDTSLSSAG